jgi:hypothetical protein
VRPLTRGNEDGAALLYNLVELGRKPNQNKLLGNIVNALLEACTGLDHVVVSIGPGCAGVGGEQLVNAAKDIAQRR